MDVTCERCGTEYEFDETLVSDRGTTVKCTNCGHLFKVFRPGAEPSVADAKTWTLETRDGGTQQISSLKELQRLITAGEVTSDDRISRSGEGWKRLGDIAELQTFFAAARAAEPPKSAGPAREPSAPRRDPTQPQPHQIAAPGARPQPPPGPPGRGKGTMLGMGQKPAEPGIDGSARTVEMAMSSPAAAPASAMPRPQQTLKSSPPPARVEPHRPPSVRPAAMRPPSYTPPSQPKDISSGDVEMEPPSAATHREPAARTPVPPRPEARSAPRPPERPTPARPSDRPRALRVDEDEDDLPRPPQRSFAGPFLAVVLLLALGVGGYFGWPYVQQMMVVAPADAPGAAFLAAGDAALALDRTEAYEDAASEYTKALALDEHNPRVLTGLSRAHALIAQNHLFDAIDLDARAATEPSAAGEATVVRRQATSEAADAREYAEAAVRQGDGGADAEVALSDALRLSGEAALARSRLDRALTLASSPSAEALRVSALLDSEAGGLASAVDAAERAVAEDPGLIRARLLLARAQLAAGNTSSARAQVLAIFDRDPDHPVAIMLRDRLDAAGPTVVELDAGPVAVVTPEVTPTDRPPEAPPVVTPDRPSSPGATSTPAPRGDYDALVAQADAQLENDHPDRARPLYEAALRARPGGPAAVTGLGFVLLDQGNYQGALSQFRQATSAGYGHAFIGLGSTYRQLRDFDHALEAYESYLARLPSGPEASIARRQADLLRAQGARSGSSPSPSTPSTPTTPPPSGDPPPSTDTPVTHESVLPAPRGATEPPTPDVPAIDSEP